MEATEPMYRLMRQAPQALNCSRFFGWKEVAVLMSWNGTRLPCERMRTFVVADTDACRVWTPYGEPLRVGSPGGEVLRGDMGMIE